MDKENTIAEAVILTDNIPAEVRTKEELVDVVITKDEDGKITETKVTTITEIIIKDVNQAIEEYDKEIANLDEGIANNQAQIAHLQAIRQKYVDKKAEATKEVRKK